MGGVSGFGGVTESSDTGPEFLAVGVCILCAKWTISSIDFGLVFMQLLNYNSLDKMNSIIKVLLDTATKFSLICVAVQRTFKLASPVTLNM